MIEIARQPEDIQQVGDLMTLVRHAEKYGKFYCEGGGDGRLPLGRCGKNLSCYLLGIPNDGNDYVRRCSKCGRTLYFNAGWLAAKVIQAQQLERAGHAPAVGTTFKDVKGAGSTRREELLPDGRKRIIVTPLPAICRAVAQV